MRSAAIPIAHPLSLAMTPDERTFFQALGARVAQARKDADLTQVQLAERLGIPQPQLASYEVGRRRVPVSLLPRLARALAMPIETLIADDGPPPPPARRGPVSRLQQQVDAIAQLPKAKQKFVVEMLDTVLAQHVA
jgi:transcriptional regulator with XRE-family HTH domain